MSTEYFQDERVSLHIGDALAVLASLETGSVDALITDPPYSSGGMTRADRASDVHSKYVQNDSVSGQALGAFGGDNRDQRSFGYWSALWIGEALRVVKPGGVACLFTDWRQLPITTDALQAGGFVWRGIVPWYKPSARPQAGRFTAHCEYVVWGSAGGLPIDLTAPVLPGFYQASPPRDRDHITQKPVDVMRSIVKIAPPEGVILDPFMGAGTTGVAAVIEGRQFIGSEMTDHYAAIAERRIRTARGEAISKGDQDAFDFGEAS